MHKETVIDRVEVLEHGALQVRRADYLVEDDGTRSLLRYHRVSYPPGWNIDDEAADVKQIAAVAWTPERLAAQKGREVAQKAKATRGQKAE